MSSCVSRRSLLKRAGYAAACAGVFPAPAVLADPKPNQKLNLAAIGCGGRGLYAGPAASYAKGEVNLVAMVDADAGVLAKALKTVSAAIAKAGKKDFDTSRIKTFNDYRPMYDKIHKDIDAVLVATPDHQHACPTMTAIKLGKHVYCEKPLVHHISEARALGEAAKAAPKVATQMGNQGSGTGNHQSLAEYLEAGAIGQLREVHAWHVFANRFGGSMPKPEPEETPAELNWDAWLGPARSRPFAKVYRPWHGWHDFGTGSLGGWGPHMMDAVFFALKLGYPSRVELIEVDDVSEDRFPRHSTVRYDFPARGALPPISVFWYEGSKPNTDPNAKTPDGKPAQTKPHLPPLFAEMEKQDKKYADSRRNAGNLFVGDKGMICCSSHGGPPTLFPIERRKEFEPPAKKLARPSGGIMGDFLSACAAGGGPTFSGFGTFSGPFMETLLVGHLAMLAGLNKPVEWDGAAMRVKNLPELNQFVSREYRKGWSL